MAKVPVAEDAAEKSYYKYYELEIAGCEFMVSCNAQMGEMKVPVVMVEVAKKINDVMTFQARFWIGYQIINGEAQYLLPPEVQLPEEICLGLIGHNIKEFTHLGEILPQVYAEGSGKPML